MATKIRLQRRGRKSYAHRRTARSPRHRAQPSLRWDRIDGFLYIRG